MVVNAINPFNGTFVGREVIERIGYPKPELFIWGDEVEYMYRATKHGIELRTIVRAIHYHPAARVEIAQSRLFRFHVNKQRSKLRNYCDYRNKAYITWQYERLGIVAHFGRYILFYLERFDFAGLIFFMRASLDGVCKRERAPPTGLEVDQIVSKRDFVDIWYRHAYLRLQPLLGWKRWKRQLSCDC